MSSFDSLSRISAFLIAFSAGLAVSPGSAQRALLVHIDGLSPHELRTEAFSLNGSGAVRIRATGADEHSRGRFGRNRGDFERGYWRGNAWILDAHTRDVVWELANERTERGDDGLRVFDGDVNLASGEYVVHYASYSSNTFIGNVFGRLRSRSGGYYDDGLSEEFAIEISGDGHALGEEEMRNARNYFNQSAVVSFIGLEDEESQRLGFNVARATEVEIYAIGEVIDESTYDYGWITNIDTGERVWRFDYWNTEYAGGAEKNRQDRTTIMLEPGRYAAFFVTDDFHDAWDWNAAPPYDPEFYGLTVRTTDIADRENITTFTYERVPRQNVIAELVGLGDDETASHGFTLAQDMDLRVYALGEGISGDMYDYGWIMNARTRETVWRMDYRDTEHAGGADKNREITELIHLDAGSYIVYFTTDGSHSYWDWNSSPPIDGELWGITLSGVGDFESAAVSAYSRESDPNIIAQLIEVGDYERERTSFTLSTEMTVRIYAVGEGDRSEMYDYGWIENARTGRVVWEMEYRETDRAGGARKNRVANETITLAAGEYLLHYESDGSHSFGDWNADPPDDPSAWGITIYRLNSS